MEEPTSSLTALCICYAILFSIFISSVNIVTDSYFTNDDDNEDYRKFSNIIELILFIIFATEYVLRVLSSTAYGDKLQSFLISPLNIVDFVSILPYLLSIFMSNTSISGLKIIRAIRFTRIFRIFKVSRYIKGIQIIFDTIKKSLPHFKIILFAIVFINIFTAVIMFYAES